MRISSLFKPQHNFSDAVLNWTDPFLKGKGSRGVVCGCDVFDPRDQEKGMQIYFSIVGVGGDVVFHVYRFPCVICLNLQFFVSDDAPVTTIDQS